MTYARCAVLVLGSLWLLCAPALGFDCTLKFSNKELGRLPAMVTEAEIGQWAAALIKRQHGVVSSGPALERVQAVADRLRQVVQKRPEILYTVGVLDTFEKGACAYPGGYIFLTKGLLTLTSDDDELAIILAHEFAHVAAGQTDRPMEYELSERLKKRLVEVGAVGRGFTSELRTRFCDDVTIDEVRKIKELQADQDAIIYASLAGYNATAAYTILDKVAAGDQSSCQPSREERKARVTQQVQGVVEQLEKFHAGVRLYVQQEYARAAEAFTAFLSVYPGREVHHNLATAYHRLALSSRGGLVAIEGKCSLALESETGAARLHARPRTLSGDGKFQRYLSEAITQYTHALKQDPTYAPAAANLACAYLAQGKYARAQGELEDVLQSTPGYAMAYNNLGMVFLLQEDRRKALTQFDKAVRLNPGYADPHFNLGLVWEAEGQQERARSAWQRYLQLLGGGNSVYGRFARDRLGLPEAENTGTKIAPDAEMAALPIRPGQPGAGLPRPERTVALFAVCVGQDGRACPQVQALVYERSGMTVLVEDSVVKQVVIEPPSKQTTAKGIGIGQTEDQVREKYRVPSRVEEHPTGRYLIYDALRLALAIRQGRVASWFVFQ